MAAKRDKSHKTKRQNMAPFMRNGRVLLASWLRLPYVSVQSLLEKRKRRRWHVYLWQAKKKRELIYLQIYDKFLCRVVYTDKLQRRWQFFAVKKPGRQIFNKCIWEIKFAKNLPSTRAKTLWHKNYDYVKKLASLDPPS